MFLFHRKTLLIAFAVTYVMASNCLATGTIYHEHIHTSQNSESAYAERMKNAELFVKALDTQETLFRSEIKLKYEEEKLSALDDHLEKYHKCNWCKNIFLTLFTKDINVIPSCYYCQQNQRTFAKPLRTTPFDEELIGFLQLSIPSAQLKCYVCKAPHDINLQKCQTHLSRTMVQNPQAHHRKHKLADLKLNPEFALVVAQAGMTIGKDTENKNAAICEQGCGFIISSEKLLDLQTRELDHGYYPPLIQHIHFSATKKKHCKFVQQLMTVAEGNEKIVDRMDREETLAHFEENNFLSKVELPPTKPGSNTEGADSQQDDASSSKDEAKDSVGQDKTLTCEMMVNAGQCLLDKNTGSTHCIFHSDKDPFSKHINKNWNQDDNPNWEHLRHFPDCLISQLAFTKTVWEEAKKENLEEKANAKKAHEEQAKGIPVSGVFYNTAFDEGDRRLTEKNQLSNNSNTEDMSQGYDDIPEKPIRNVEHQVGQQLPSEVEGESSESTEPSLNTPRQTGESSNFFGNTETIFKETE